MLRKSVKPSIRTSVESLKNDIDDYMDKNDKQAQHLYQEYAKLFNTSAYGSKSLVALRLLVDIYEKNWNEKYLNDKRADKLLTHTKHKFEKIENIVPFFMSKLAVPQAPLDEHSLIFYCKTTIDPEWFFNTFVTTECQELHFREMGDGYFSVSTPIQHEIISFLSVLTHHQHNWEKNDSSWCTIDARDYVLPSDADLCALSRSIFVRPATTQDRVTEYPIIHVSINSTPTLQELVIAHWKKHREERPKKKARTVPPPLSKQDKLAAASLDLPQEYVNVFYLTIQLASSDGSVNETCILLQCKYKRNNVDKTTFNLKNLAPRVLYWKCLDIFLAKEQIVQNIVPSCCSRQIVHRVLDMLFRR